MKNSDAVLRQAVAVSDLDFMFNEQSLVRSLELPGGGIIVPTAPCSHSREEKFQMILAHLICEKVTELSRTNQRIINTDDA